MVYDVIGLPPWLSGARQLTVTCSLPAVGLRFVTMPGTPCTITALAVAEVLSPSSFVARTANW
jgi:hypothetical protein